MPRTYDSEALLLAANERKEQYTQLVSQLQSLNKKYMAIIQDEEFQGKGADAIKNFYTEHTILIGKWIGFCYMQIAFINSIPGEITDHNLSEKTFIREEFVEGEVRDGIEKSREMVVDQKETLDKILSGIKDILPLEVFSSEAFETNMRKTSKRATKSVQNMHKADIVLTEDYGTSKMNQQFIKQYYTELNQATNGSKNVNQIMFSTEDFRKREFYKDIEAVDENAVEYVKEKNEELRVRRVKELKKKLENYHKLSQAEFLEIGKEIGYDELTSEQQSVYRAYVNAKNKADFGRGVTQGISETATEALDSVLNLGESAQGLGQAIKDPMETLNIMVDDVKTSYTRDVIEGDTVSRSSWFTSEFLSIIGTKGIGSAAKKSMEASKIGNKVSEGADAVKRKMPSLEDIPYNAMSPAGLSSSFRVNSIDDLKKQKKPGANGKRDAISSTENKIIYPSKPHTNKTPGHWEAMTDKAEELAENEDITKVYLNKGLSNEITGIKPNRRPDIMAVRKDGKIDQYEVPSKTDNIFALRKRMQDNQKLLGDRAGDIYILPPKV